MYKPSKKSLITRTILAVRRRWHYYFRLSGIKYPDQVEHSGRSIFYQSTQWIALLGIVVLWLIAISFAINIFLIDLGSFISNLLIINVILFILIVIDTLPLVSFFFDYTEERRIVTYCLFLNLLYGANAIICLLATALANRIGNNSFKAIIIDPFLNAL